MVSIVDGHVPVEIVAVTGHGSRDGGQIGKNKVGHAKEGSTLFGLSDRKDSYPEISLFRFDLRRRIGSVKGEGKLAIRALYSSLQVLRHICLPVKKRDMARIQVAFIGLEIVALVINFSDQPVSRRRIERFVRGQKGRFSGTHVGKDESRHFPARIGGMVNLVTKVFVRRLAGLFQTIAMNVIEPTVIEAAESAVFHSTVSSDRRDDE